jgi:hypothetical protein
MLNSLSGLSGANVAGSSQAAPTKASRTTRRADQLTLIRHIVAVWAFPVQMAPRARIGRDVRRRKVTGVTVVGVRGHLVRRVLAHLRRDPAGAYGGRVAESGSARVPRRVGRDPHRRVLEHLLKDLEVHALETPGRALEHPGTAPDLRERLCSASASWARRASALELVRRVRRRGRRGPRARARGAPRGRAARCCPPARRAPPHPCPVSVPSEAGKRRVTTGTHVAHVCRSKGVQGV